MVEISVTGVDGPRFAPPAPVPVMVRRWRCPTCGKAWAKKETTQQHLAWGCVHDPASRACMTCEYFDDLFYDTGESCRKGLTVARPIPRDCPEWTRRVRTVR